MKLHCVSGPLAQQVFELAEGRSLVMGREPDSTLADDQLILPSKTVSRSHCRVEPSAVGGWQVLDLESSNGTRLNRKAVESVPVALRSGDQLQVGEFSFRVETDEPVAEAAREEISQRTPAPSTQSKKRFSAPAESNQKIKELLYKAQAAALQLKARFERLDLSRRMLIVILLAASVAHLIATSLMLGDARTQLLDQSLAVGKELVRNLANTNQDALAEKSALLLDCAGIRQNGDVVNAYVLGPERQVLCPIGLELNPEGINRVAAERGELVDNCRFLIGELGEETCDFVMPVKIFRQDLSRLDTVGFARIEYSPRAALAATQSLQSTRFNTFFVSLALMLAAWWLIVRWLRSSVAYVADGLRVAAQGHRQSLEMTESFASFEPLIEEANRLIAKGSQGLKANSQAAVDGASFLQILFQQVLLLEERAVLIVDQDNQVVAASPALDQILPFDRQLLGAHITEAVTDTHLQGDLVAYLNDLAQGVEVVDRSLSMNDRVIQVRGMPLFLNDQYAAAILIF
jgi:pSer/pThr/pTyr-binding forkhead associated (FHA) protein